MRNLKPELLDQLASAYVLGTLSARARRRVVRRMKTDPSLEQMVHAWEARLLPLALRLPPVTPPLKNWKAIESRIGAAGVERHWLRSLLETPASTRWLLAGQTLAIVGLSLSLVFSQLHAPEFETHSTPPAIVAKGHLRVVFQETIRELEMRALLQAIDGTIIEGPGAMGVYTISLANPATLETALTILRRDSRVRLAQALKNN